MPALLQTELTPRPRLPEWLRIKLPTSDTFGRTRALLDELKLHTVCESAKCPNHWECWSKGTATFMIAGDRCTREAVVELVRDGGRAVPDGHFEAGGDQVGGHARAHDSKSEKGDLHDRPRLLGRRC